MCPPSLTVTFVALVLLGAAPALAQEAPAPARPAAGPRPAPRPLHAGPPRPRPSGPDEQEVLSLAGTLAGYRADNDDQVYDGFDLGTSAGTELVRFPRHLGQALLAAARPGRRVTVTAFRDIDPLGRPVLRLASLTAGSQTVRDAPPPRPASPPAEVAATVRGTVQRLARDPLGRTAAVVLADGNVLRLPPAAAEQLAGQLRAGTTVAATGVLRAAGPGEAVARPVRVVRVQTITLGGVQFLVR